MNLIVTAVIPQSLAADISAKLATVFDGEFIADASQSLTSATIGSDAVYCFSGVFSEEEIATLTTLGLALPGVLFWVQDGETGIVVSSSQVSELGQAWSPRSLIDSAGVSFHSSLDAVVEQPIS